MYIKRTEALELLGKLSREPHYQHEGEDYYVGIAEASGEIYSMPAADVAPVVYGEWEDYDCYTCNSDGEPVVKHGSVFVCSVCGREEYVRERYCHCGAKMKV